VFAHVIARDMRQARSEVSSSGIEGYRAAGICVWPYAGEQSPTPAAAQVQSVEVRDLAVAAVADCRGLE